MKKICFALGTVVFLAACSKDKSTVNQLNEPITDEMARPFMISLSGAQEAPGPGDPDGSGTAHLSLNQGQGTITYHLEVQNIDAATGAHIHKAPAGSPGPVVVALMAPVNGSSSGTVNVDPALIKDIRKNPSDYYVNVHTSTFPGGAVRGQISK